ncbi:hypothetical protein E4Z66_03965 [Aliishimia ponticola]|uniref:Sulfotransferase domain-containing protein n=1 Tax=Aliishimia ponticola TaxID=2499833 RepID=A0A4V3XKY2_9RHOB|nr:hypothetical protein [Aliishimia ponticola]THH38733.1 hypothetical protein E4Z66_03965 [Aliishimia ponticola]
MSLHLGAHKTASTHLERMLRQNVSAHGFSEIRVAKKRDIRDAITSKLDQVKHKEELSPELIAGVTKLLRRKSTIVVSDENILGTTTSLFEKDQFYPNAERRMRRVKRLLAGYDVTVFLAIRNPADFITSSYCEAVRHSGYIPFEDYVDGDDLKKMRWSNLVRRISKAAPGVKICLWQFEYYPTIWRQVSERMLNVGKQRAGQIEWLDEVARPGMSAKALKEFKRLRGTELTREQADDILFDNPRSRWNGTPDLFTRAQRQSLNKRFQRDLAELTHIDNVEFIGPLKAPMQATSWLKRRFG